MDSWIAGQLVQATATFTVGGVATDPSTVTCVLEKPDGTTTTYTYAGGGVAKDSTGQYHLNVDTTAGPTGVWQYHWSGTGADQSSQIGSFFVYNPGF